MSACKYCEYSGRLATGDFCSLTCEALQRVYQRGRDEERAKALSGADDYLKQAITEATNEAHERGEADERNRIADALDEEANPDAYSYDVKFALRSFAERLRKGEV